MKNKNIFNKLFCLTLFTLIFYGLCCAEGINDFTQLDPYVKKVAEEYIDKDGSASILIGISLNGKSKIYSFTKKGLNYKEPDEESVMEIGSITKTLTAIILQNLIDQKKCSPDSELREFFPAHIKSIAFNNKEITLTHLATQSSGLPRMPLNWLGTVKDYRRPYTNYTLKDLTDFMETCKIDTEPGTVYGYSNLNFALLGLIIEKISKDSYENCLKKYVFDRTGMKDSFISGRPDLKNRVMQGYAADKPLPSWNFRVFKATGAVKSTMKDMMLYLNANINADKEGGLSDFLRAQQSRCHDKKSSMDLGYAWHIVNIGTEKKRADMVWHNGGTGGFRSFTGFVRKSRTGVVVLCNSVNSADPAGIKILKKINSL